MHAELLGDRRESCREILYVEVETFQREFGAGQIGEVLFSCLVLLDVNDVPVMLVDEVRDGRAEPFAIRALDKQNRCVLQGFSGCALFYLSPASSRALDSGVTGYSSERGTTPPRKS